MAVRLWNGYPLGLDYSSFGEVPDDALPALLDRIAAKCMSEQMSLDDDNPLSPWVKSKPEPAPHEMPGWSEDERMRFWTGHIGLPFALEPEPQPPHWVTFHFESSISRAQAITDALFVRCDASCPVQVKLTEQHELRTEEWLCLERELQEFDKINRLAVRAFGPGEWDRHLLKRLREEALALSKLLPHTVAPSERAPRDESAPAAKCESGVADGIAPATSTWRATPAGGKLHRGWNAILKAAGGKTDRNAQVVLREQNKALDGPIRIVRGRPEVFEPQLKSWLHDLDGRARLSEEARESDNGAKQELEERGGARLEDYKLHVERRPNARGKAGPPRAE